MAKKWKPDAMSAEEREQYAARKREEQREAVEASVRSLMDSDGWRRWVEARQRFHNYSFGNTLMIAAQKPDATMVASFTTWKDLGRHVCKGETGIRILAPMTLRKRVSGEVATVGTSSAATVGQVVAATVAGIDHSDFATFTRFKVVSVFDISQTDGVDLPDMPREPIEGDSHAEYLPDLERFATELGYSVRYGDTGPAGGWCDAKKREIVISDRKSPNGCVRTLVHEIAHALGVDYTDYSRDDAEVIVETAAIIACGTLGLDTSGESIPYIAGWGHGSDLAAMRKYAEKVDECASKIEIALGIRTPRESREAVAA